MSIKFTKRIASELLGRGENALRLRTSSLDDIKKAITRDDVRNLIKTGAIVALKPRYELYKRSKQEYKKKGHGKRKGTLKARQGRVWERKVRSQRVLLKRLKEIKKIDNTTFKRYYLLVKGNSFPDKRSLVLHLSDEGIKISEEEVKQLKEYARSLHK